MAYAFGRNIIREVQKIEFKWIFCQFSSYNMKSDEYFESQKIYGADNNYYCCLELYPNAENYGEEFLSTYIKIVPLKTPCVSASFSVSILDYNGNKMNTVYTTQFYDFYENIAWGFDSFLPRSELFNVLDGNILTLFFEITVSYLSFMERNEKYIENTMKIIAPEISTRNTDILFSVEGMLFYAHRDVVLLKSNYFKNALQKLRRRDICPVFLLSDINCHLFAILIRYLYTGKIDEVEQNVFKILELADKYEILELKQYCEDILIKTMNLDNIAELLAISEKYRAEKLRNHAIKFIISNATEILKSQAWNYFIHRSNIVSIIHGAAVASIEM